MVKRIDFHQTVKDHGTPSAVSDNGQVYIFMYRALPRLHVLRLTYNGFRFIKTVNLKPDIGNHLDSLPPDGKYANLRKQLREEGGKYKGLLGGRYTKFDCVYMVNDHMDVVVRFTPKPEEEDTKKKKKKEKRNKNKPNADADNRGA